MQQLYGVGKRDLPEGIEIDEQEYTAEQQEGRKDRVGIHREAEGGQIKLHETIEDPLHQLGKDDAE